MTHRPRPTDSGDDFSYRDIRVWELEHERDALKASLEEIADYRQKPNDLYELERLRKVARRALKALEEK